VFSLLWSEHCAYKHSALALRRLPTDGPHVLRGPGGNAGVVDVGGGQAVAFKVESHNHPSAVEPFQGAATGVGGILRDVVAMGARPIAFLDALRFGEPGWAFDRAVAGIGAYGNSVGVATVGGEAAFDSSYTRNPLVNAMCVGLLPSSRALEAQEPGPGAVLVLFGAATGRDGIGGASVLASRELADGSDDLRPTVQIADPFTANKLVEASLELVERGAVTALQDLGAAGLASSLAELAPDGAGIDVDLDAVPLREAGLEPWEIMISESQERMLAVAARGRVDEVLAVCARRELERAVVGELTATSGLRAFRAGELVCDLPIELLTARAPRTELKGKPRPTQPPAGEPRGPAPPEALLRLLASPNVGSKAPVYSRFDHLVGARTVRRPSLDAAVLRLRPSLRGLAVSLDGCGRIAALAPRTGGALAVLEAARNVACTGARPLALTDCLNLGSPERPQVAWELGEVVEGIAEACEALRIPVVSGNVSLYNETEGVPIDPTPVVGCVGVVDDVRLVPRAWREGDAIVLASASAVELDGSEYQAAFAAVGGRPAALDLAAEAALVHFLRRAAPLSTLVHDASLGGLACCLARAAIVSGAGATLELPADPRSLFGEGGGRAVVACAQERVDEVLALADGVRARPVGTVGGAEILGVRVSDARAAWERAV
jgi:phosphoribosylformylglycinamidine synthase subunit PurL